MIDIILFILLLFNFFYTGWVGRQVILSQKATMSSLKALAETDGQLSRRININSQRISNLVKSAQFDIRWRK